MSPLRLVRLAPLALLLVVAASCGGGSSPANDSTATTVRDPKDAVRAQLASVVTSYIETMVRQRPDVTTNVKADEITTCVKDRVNQMVDAAEQLPNQPDDQFVASILDQTQSSLYGLIGSCARFSG